MERVIVADSQPLFLDGLGAIVSGLLTGNGTCRTVGTYADMAAAIAADTGPDCVIVDMALLGAGGPAEILSLRRNLHATTFVVLSQTADPQLAQLCLRCGAAAIIPRTASRAEIAVTLQTVFEGGIVEPSCLALPAGGPLPLAIAPDEDSDNHALSGRQMAVLDLVRDGKSNKQIAWELSISETTVKAHMTAILRKLGVNSRAQAIVLLQRQGQRGHDPVRLSRGYPASRAA